MLGSDKTSKRKERKKFIREGEIDQEVQNND